MTPLLLTVALAHPPAPVFYPPPPVVVIRNGIDRISLSSGAGRSNKPIKIVHVGTLYMGRDPRPFQPLQRVVSL